MKTLMLVAPTFVAGLLLLIGGCAPDDANSSTDAVEPATVVQAKQITRLLEKGVQVRNVYRVRSVEHPNAWYLAGRVYGAGAIDGGVAVWFLSDRPGEIETLRSVDTMADACSYAPLETETQLSWKDEEVQRLEAYVAARR